MGQTGYYCVVIALSALNVVLAVIAYVQRSKQIRGHRLSEEQVRLAEARNELAQSRLHRLEDQVALMTEIRDALAAAQMLPRMRDADRPRPVVGVIDVGSATMRLTVGRYTAEGWKSLRNERAFLQLGAEVERSGSYAKSALENVAATGRTFMAAANEVGCERLAIVVTAPGRMGSNPGDLLETLTQATGRWPVLLAPQQEARLTFVGAANGALGRGQTAVVCDIGGGSTEVSAGSLGSEVEIVGSFDVGSVRLAEKHFMHDPPTSDELEAARADAAGMLRIERHPAAKVALATGGCAHTLAKLGEPLLEAASLERAMTLAITARKQAKRLHRHRRQALPGGIVLLECIHRRLGMPLTVAPGGLRQGVLRELDADRFHETYEMNHRRLASVVHDAAELSA
jgi:exopolyphosphatase / guanosine-5'-triphosphate,3'-diphosphate pyrophosphatase